MKKFIMLGLGLLGLVASASAQTADPSSVVTDVNGITTTASTSYIAAAGLGVAALTVGVIVYMSRKGWKLR